MRIYNNRFESTARESIQIGAGVSDVQIYNNSVLNYGTQNGAEQNGGVQLGVGTSARFYNNLIKNGTGPALAIQGIGNEYIYNNVFVNPGAGGAITINTRPTPLSTDIVNKGYLGGVYLINNTFVSAATGAAVEYVNSAPGNVMYNNLIVASATKWDNTYRVHRLEEE
ncbi:MAG: right-handed parallel beta-helix repeat-containing protein [Bacteroidota bacterium]